MEKEITKSYAIKRIAELTEENEVLRNDVKFLKNEYQIRINSYKKFYEELLSAKDNEIKRLNKQSINFAIAELEKANKELIKGNYIIYGWTPNDAITIKINEQIKELKENRC